MCHPPEYDLHVTLEPSEQDEHWNSEENEEYPHHPAVRRSTYTTGHCTIEVVTHTRAVSIFLHMHTTYLVTIHTIVTIHMHAT